jgi:hypothetical protein
MKLMFLPSLILLGSLSAISLCMAADNSNPAAKSQASTTEPQPTQAHLGIGVSPLPPVLTSHLPDVIGKGRGVLVSDVTEGSPADKAGLRVHDVLIRYDDQDLYSPEQLVKRVRNDRPGKEIELQYVRAGKVSTLKLTLGEQPVQAPTMPDWPGLMGRFDFPTIPFRPDALAEDLTKDLDTLTDGSQWTRFESMSVSKGADGEYRATMKYKDEKGDSIDREYVGTRQEVRDAIKGDKTLPESQKEQLLRSLDDHGSLVNPDFQLPTFPKGFPWNHELFSGPDVNF